MENNSFFHETNSIDFRQEIYKYLYFWPYFIVSLAIFFICSFIYLRYTDYVYEITAKIQIIDKAQDSEMSLPTSMTIFNRSMVNLENEIGVLSSFSLHDKVIEKLNYNIKYFTIGRLKTSENHRNKWLQGNYNISFKNDITEIKEYSYYDIQFKSNSMVISHYNYNDDLIKKYDFLSYTTENISHNLPFELSVNEEHLNKETEKRVVLYPFEDTVLKMSSSVTINEVGQSSDQLDISLKYANKVVAEEYINTLLVEFDNDGIKDRQLEYKRTMEFVDSRSDFLRMELEQIENNKQSFKEENNLSNIDSNADVNANKKILYNDEIFKFKSQRDLVLLLRDVIEDDKNKLIPLDIGIENINLNKLISEYNLTQKERDRYLLSAGPNNIVIKNLNSQLNEYRVNIERSLDNYLVSLDLSINNFEQKETEYTEVYKDIPENEKILRSIQRELEIKEALFLLLLQKREEAAINLAVVNPSIKIIDNAKSSMYHISPNKSLIFLSSFTISILIPFLILTIRFFMDNKIHTREILQELVRDIPIIAEIPFIPNNKLEILSNISRDALSESIRMLVANLNFVLFGDKRKEKSNLILVTSSIKGEGKTVVSVNTASALLSRSKKILLMGADLRNPQIHKFIGIDKNSTGLADYIYRDDIEWRDIIIKESGLDVMISGTIPPNPTELLSSEKFSSLVNELREIYDYVIIDSAPCLLVSDTFEISKHIDTTLYVVRANFTDKNICTFINECHNSNKLKNISLILNSVGSAASYGYRYGYGYKYGYQYGYNYGYGYGYNEDKS